MKSNVSIVDKRTRKSRRIGGKREDEKVVATDEHKRDREKKRKILYEDDCNYYTPIHLLWT